MLPDTSGLFIETTGASSRRRCAAAATSQPEFDAAFATCRQLLVEGKLDSSGRGGSGAAGAAAGATTAAVGGAMAQPLADMPASLRQAPPSFSFPSRSGPAWGMSKMKRCEEGARDQDGAVRLPARARLPSGRPAEGAEQADRLRPEDGGQLARCIVPTRKADVGSSTGWGRRDRADP